MGAPLFPVAGVRKRPLDGLSLPRMGGREETPSYICYLVVVVVVIMAQGAISVSVATCIDGHVFTILR